MLQLMRESCLYTYPPLSVARYSFKQLSEIEQCRVKKLAQGFNTAAQDSNPGSLSREFEAYTCAIALYNLYSSANKTMFLYITRTLSSLTPFFNLHFLQEIKQALAKFRFPCVHKV